MMCEKFYITNDCKLVSRVQTSGAQSYKYAFGESSLPYASLFKFSDAKKFWNQILGDSMEWCIQKVHNHASRKNYIITTATTYVASNATVTSNIATAKSFKSVADAEAYINNHRELLKNIPKPIVINSDFERCERSVKKEFTQEQLSVFGKSINIASRPAISASVRHDLYDKSTKTCAICGRPIEYKDVTIDHIQPLSRGGEHQLSNFACVCEECNKFKGSSTNKELNKRCAAILSNTVSTKNKEYALPVIRSYVRAVIQQYMGGESYRPVWLENSEL